MSDPKDPTPTQPRMLIPAPPGSVSIGQDEETKMPCPACAKGMVSTRLHARLTKCLQEYPLQDEDDD